MQHLVGNLCIELNSFFLLLYIGTEQIIQEKISNHIKNMHSGASLQNQPKIDVEKAKTYRKQCEICQQMIFGTAFSMETHISNCKIYGKYFKRTSSGYECVECLENHLGRERIIAHIRAKHRNLIQV